MTQNNSNNNRKHSHFIVWRTMDILCSVLNAVLLPELSQLVCQFARFWGQPVEPPWTHTAWKTTKHILNVALSYSGHEIYVTSSDSVFKHRICDGKLLCSWRAEGSSFNDIAVTQDDFVVLLDRSNSCVLVYKPGVTSAALVAQWPAYGFYITLVPREADADCVVLSNGTDCLTCYRLADGDVLHRQTLMPGHEFLGVAFRDATTMVAVTRSRDQQNYISLFRRNQTDNVSWSFETIMHIGRANFGYSDVDVTADGSIVITHGRRLYIVSSNMKEMRVSDELVWPSSVTCVVAARRIMGRVYCTAGSKVVILE